MREYLNICIYFNFGDLKKKLKKIVNFDKMAHLLLFFKNIYDNFYEFIAS